MKLICRMCEAEEVIVNSESLCGACVTRMLFSPTRTHKATAPHRLLDLASRNVIVSTALQYWRSGECSWEDALAIAVVALAEQNDALWELELERMRKGQ